MTDSDQEDKEARRLILQADIDSRRSARERNRLGQFATPTLLAVEITRAVERLLPPDVEKIRFADPSVGTGSFFSAAMAVFGSKRLESSIGVEIDPTFAETAQALWGPLGLEVVREDFIEFMARRPHASAPNLILANPPYVRHHHLAPAVKARLGSLTAARTGVTLSGLAGLYAHFMLLATSWLEDGGVAAWLVPSEFMDVNYGAPLREFLSKEVTLLRVHRFDPEAPQFGDALVSSAVVILRKMRPLQASHEVAVTFGGTLADPAVTEMVAASCLRASTKWTEFPRHATNDRIRRIDSSGVTLGDLFTIKRGIATGGNSFFVLDRETSGALDLPPSVLTPILPSARYITSDVIEADSDGVPLLDKQLFLVDCTLPPDVVEQRFPALSAYLQSDLAERVRKGFLLSHRVPWYKQEQRAPAPFVCTYMGRSLSRKSPFRFMWNRSRAVATNTYLLLYPTPRLAALIDAGEAPLEDLHRLFQRLTGDELRGEGRVYGGGLNKIEPKELARVSARGFLERWPRLADQVSGAQTLELFAGV